MSEVNTELPEVVKEPWERPSSKLKRKRLLEALQKNAGIVSYAVKAANVSLWFYYEQYQKNPEFKKQVDEIQNNRLDMAEAMLLKKIQEGDMTAVIFFLKTKGKHRGYVERVEADINTQMTINVVRRD